MVAEGEQALAEQEHAATRARLEAEAREGSRFRPAMVALMADFLLRHGLLTPDAEPEYEELLLALHRPRLVL